MLEVVLQRDVREVGRHGHIAGYAEFGQSRFVDHDIDIDVRANEVDDDAKRSVLSNGRDLHIELAQDFEVGFRTSVAGGKGGALAGAASDVTPNASGLAPSTSEYAESSTSLKAARLRSFFISLSCLLKATCPPVTAVWYI